MVVGSLLCLVLFYGCYEYTTGTRDRIPSRAAFGLVVMIVMTLSIFWRTLRPTVTIRYVRTPPTTQGPNV